MPLMPQAKPIPVCRRTRLRQSHHGAGRSERFWNVKVEGHFMNGYGFCTYPDGFYPEVNPQGFKPNTNALVVKDRSQFLGAGTQRKIVMKRLRILLTAAGLTVFAVWIPSRADVKVIANSSVRTDTISVGELKRVFLEETISLGTASTSSRYLKSMGRPTKPSARVPRMSEDDLQAYYSTLVFTGRGFTRRHLNPMPRSGVCGPDAVPVGYVSNSASTEGVKTLAIGVPSISAERKADHTVEPDYPETLKRLNIGGTGALAGIHFGKRNVENVVLLGGNRFSENRPRRR